MKLGKYSFGVGDRFGHQGKAQLKALLKARNLGIELIPVWNKSFREHQIIGTQPDAVREEADESIIALGYTGAYYVDADHINLSTVDGFLKASDFFTLDVAGFIGKNSEEGDGQEKAAGMQVLKKLGNKVEIEGLPEPIVLSDEFLSEFLDMYYNAIVAASDLYKYINTAKGADNVIPEVSMDEVENPQSPKELLLILALLADFKVPVQTIAPKFSGRFNKGVDYVGDVDQFRAEFEADLLVIKYSIEKFNLPENLKLSIHSGSDKFTIYPIMGELIRKHDMGIHVKTAGTTWLEEVIGLSLAGEESLKLVKELYKGAIGRQEELCRPYADVIDIDSTKLPADIDDWSGEKIADTLRHVPDNPAYNNSMRQLIHVGYKLAAEKGDSYLQLLKDNEDIIGQQVEENIYDRHITRLFEL